MSTCTPSHTVISLRLLINTGDTLGDSRYLRTYRDFQRPALENGGRSPESRVPFF